MSFRVLEKVVCFIFEPRCPLCNQVVDLLNLCSQCSNWPKVDSDSSNSWTSSTFKLTDKARELLHSIKYYQQPERLRLLRSKLPDAISVDWDPHTVLIPVPLSNERFFERGFNQSEWLARRMAKKLDLKIEINGLIKIKETIPQSTLSRIERTNNLFNAFSWNPKIPAPKKVCLIDDVYTTGSTLEACKMALVSAGIEEIRGWTLFKVIPDVFQSSKDI